jgi:hypothetical protein
LGELGLHCVGYIQAKPELCSVMYVKKWIFGPVLMLSGFLFLHSVLRIPSKPSSPIPSLPVMGSLGMGMLIGGIVIGAVLYLWKRRNR